MIFLKNTSTFYWKCLATSTGLLFRRLHLSWELKFFSSLSLSPRLFNLLIIYGSSSHIRRLANDNVRIYVGIPNCLTIASTSYKNYFQYGGVPLTEFINENALSITTNHSTVPLKSLWTFSAVSVPGLHLCISKFIDERKWCCSYTIFIQAHIQQFNNLWLKYQAGVIGISRGALQPNLPFGRR